MTGPPSPALTVARVSPAPLTIICGNAAPYLARIDDAPVTIGRDYLALIRVVDGRISGSHLLITPSGDGWSVIDNHSTNGTFHLGERIAQIAVTNGLTLHLGHPVEGIPVIFGLMVDGIDNVDTDTPADDTAAVDAGIPRAGAAVTTRREELGYSLEQLAAEATISKADLAALEAGQRWPESLVQARLEKALRWPPDTLAVIRSGGEDPAENDLSTEVISATVRAAIMLDSLEIHLSKLNARIVRLPSSASAPEIASGAAELLNELQTLAPVVQYAASTWKGTQSAAVLSKLRHAVTELADVVAPIPGSPLQYRLLSARRRAGLTRQEMADAADLSPADIEAVEFGHVIDDQAAVDRLERAIAVLANV